MENVVPGWIVIAIAVMLVATFSFVIVAITIIRRADKDIPHKRRNATLTGILSVLVLGGIVTSILTTNLIGIPIQDRPINDQQKKEQAAEWAKERYQINITPEEIVTFASNDEFYIAALQDTVQFQRLAGNRLILVDPETEEELPRKLSEEQIAAILGNMMFEQSGMQDDSLEKRIGKGKAQEPRE